VIFLKTGPIM